MAMIFVFGSNTKGIHGAGAAKVAQDRYGAIYGIGEGITGRAYAIPTKNGEDFSVRTLDQIQKSVDKFLEFANNHPHDHFVVTPIGCGYAKYNIKDIGPMFSMAPSNCYFPRGWVWK